MQNADVAPLLAESIDLERSGQMGAALERARKALEQFRSAGDSDGMSNALVRVGEVLYRLGHFPEMQAAANEALALAGQESRPRASALILLGHHAMETGSLDEAESCYLAAADLCRRISFDRALLSTLHNLAVCVYALRGQFDLAFAAENEADRIATRDHSPFLVSILVSLTFMHLNKGQFDQARQVLNRLVRLVPGNLPHQGYHAWLCATLAQAEGDLPTAFSFYAQARSIAEATGDLGLNVFLRMGLSSYHQMAGNASAAYEWANDAVAWANRMGTRRMSGRTLIERGRSTWLKGDLLAAESDLRLAIQDLGARQQTYDLARASLLLAALLYQQARPEADSAYLEAVSLIVSGNFSYLLERERVLAFPLLAHYLSHNDPHIQSVTAMLLDHLASVPPPPLRIATLGSFDVYRQGRQIEAAAWRRQAGELFRLLLISPGRSLSREQIIAALWPEKSLSAATPFFHQATSALRRALEPDLPDKFPSRYLIVEEGQVTLFLPPGSQVDFETFEAHFSQGEWEEAISHYPGEPFPKDRYHDWASCKRELLIQHYLRALLIVARQALQAGQHAQALDFCRRVLTEDPWLEQAVLIGMQACIHMQDRITALRLYRDLESRLQEEFSIEPTGELKALYQSLQ